MSRYSLTTGPAAEPVTFREVADQVRFVDDPDRAYVVGLITKARRFVEQRQERQLITSTWAMHLDGFPAEIAVRKLPVLTIVSIIYADGAGDSQTLSSSLYQTDLASPDAPGRIKPAYGQSWPATRVGAYNAVTVAFTCGYGTAGSDVPETTRHAILMLVAYWHDQREPVNIGNIVNPLPYTVEALIAMEKWGAYA